MAKRSLVTRRTARLASLRKKLAPQKAAVSSKKKHPTAAKASVAKRTFVSLNHLLNATALYRLGHYDRASAAFQQAMAADDADLMMDSLEELQEPVEVQEEDVVADELSPDVPPEEDLPMEDVDYLSDDFDADDDLSFDDESLETLSTDGGDVDVLTDGEEDFTVENGAAARLARVQQNLATLQKLRNQKQ